MEQLKSLNVKLDKILRILEPKITPLPVPGKEETDISLPPKAAKTKTSRKKVKEEKVGTEETASGIDKTHPKH